jgi:hypothetical protein
MDVRFARIRLNRRLSGSSGKGDVTALPKYPVFQLNLKP